MIPIRRDLVTATVLLVLLMGTDYARSQAATDTSFAASITKVPGGRIHRSLVQPDGKILVAGDFKVANGAARTALVRLNADGTTDPGFASTHYANYSETGTNVLDIELQSDGKILVCGDFFEVNGLLKYRLIRLNTDGTVDETFTQQPITATVFDIAVLPDGKILVGGLFS